MSLKELTKHNHTLAEKTPFMKAVFKKEVPKKVWTDYIYNKMYFYTILETIAREEGLLEDLPGIERASKLHQDFIAMKDDVVPVVYGAVTSYCSYLLNLKDPKDTMAHLYVWHMGDLHGGQMIKNMLPDFSHKSLEFEDVDILKSKIREKLDDSMADEANRAFEFAIEILGYFNPEDDANELLNSIDSIEVGTMDTMMLMNFDMYFSN